MIQFRAMLTRFPDLGYWLRSTLACSPQNGSHALNEAATTAQYSQDLAPRSLVRRIWHTDPPGPPPGSPMGTTAGNPNRHQNHPAAPQPGGTTTQPPQHLTLHSLGSATAPNHDRPQIASSKTLAGSNKRLKVELESEPEPEADSLPQSGSIPKATVATIQTPLPGAEHEPNHKIDRDLPLFQERFKAEMDQIKRENGGVLPEENILLYRGRYVNSRAAVLKDHSATAHKYPLQPKEWDTVGLPRSRGKGRR